ncbi:MAG: FIST N-terminal domain-containing protein [Sedimenticola sp.]
MEESPIRTGSSANPDASTAVDQLSDSIVTDDTGTVIFFCSPEYDLEQLSSALSDRLGHLNVIGCTTAGEITPQGYLSGSLTGISLPKDDFTVETVCIDQLGSIDLQRAGSLVSDARFSLSKRTGTTLTPENTFGLLLVDGMSLREEILAAGINSAISGLPMFGGSAADGTNFGTTWVYCNGSFQTDTAVFSLVHTRYAFEVFKTEHYTGASDTHVVTSADPSRRIVWEIDGYPAAEAFADMVRKRVIDLCPTTFANNPLVVRAGGHDYVRSIQKVVDDLGLMFYCAIEEGIVLKRAEKGEMLANLQQTFDSLRQKLGSINLVIGCDCILRNLEADRLGFKTELGELMAANRMIGFSTYGEQLGGMHINQTLTGIAFGESIKPGT